MINIVFFSSSGGDWQEKSTTSSAEDEVGQNLLQNEPSTSDEAVSTSKKPWMFSDKWLKSKKKHGCFLTSA